MGDNEGSSSAAQSAQEEGGNDRGFLGRIIGALSPGEVDSDSVGSDSEMQNGHSAGLIGPGIGNLRLMRVEDVAVPRAEIASVPADIALRSLVDEFREKGFTRLPVFGATLDEPLGMIHLKDLALACGFNGADPAFDLRKMLRPLLYVPPSMPIGVLLQKMQSDRKHMALVIDEYGGVDGLVTIEDLIEQVVGEIEDEHDVLDVDLWREEAPGCYLAYARTPLDEFEAAVGVRLHDPNVDDEIDTLGGLVFLLTGRVPARGEVVPHPSGTEFEVIDADPRRIKRLRVRLPNAHKE